MFLPKNIRCLVCSRIFCCGKCRQRHQELEHMDIINANHLNLDCPICNGLDLLNLHKVNINSEKLLEHIVLEHLPMQCKKCFKMFDEKSNFYDGNSKQCRIESPKIQKDVELSGALLETIPEAKINDHEIVPNIKQPGLGVDSASLLRNNSSIMKINRSADETHSKSPGQKLVRTTSTPLQETLQDPNSKLTPDSSSGGHVMMISSIRQHTPGTNSCSATESDSSHNPNNSSSFVMKKPSAPMNSRNKMLMAATPLRQVMSKSIQRALQQHGIKSFNEMREYSSRSNSDPSNQSPPVEPLDLRTTPTIRRSELQNPPAPNRVVNINQKFRAIYTASTVATSSEITISSTNLSTDPASVYETCKPVTSMEDNFDAMMTPKNAQNLGAILKKTISFDNPSVYQNSPVEGKTESSDDNEPDVWFTPTTVLARSQSCSILERPRKQIDEYDDVFFDKSPQPIKKKSGLWSLVTKTVMRIKSFRSASLTNNYFETKKVSSPVDDDELLENHEPPYIKRRKLSHPNHIFSILTRDLEKPNEISEPKRNIATSPNEANVPQRRRKIHCRPALSRMQRK